jgi:hypothetical protein
MKVFKVGAFWSPAIRHRARRQIAIRGNLKSPLSHCQVGPCGVCRTANQVFEAVLNRIEAENPERTRKLWNAEHYVDNILLTDDMLPIDRAYALSLIDAFLVHHVIDLAAQADKQAAER